MASLVDTLSHLRLPIVWSNSTRARLCIAQARLPSFQILGSSQEDNCLLPSVLKRSALTSIQRRNFTRTNRSLQKAKFGAKESWTQIDPLDVTELKSNIGRVIEQLKTDLSKLRGGGRFDHAVVEQLRVELQKGSKETVKLGTLAQIVPKSRFLNVVVGEPEVSLTAKLCPRF